jgi:hypothetical protein
MSSKMESFLLSQTEKSSFPLIHLSPSPPLALQFYHYKYYLGEDGSGRKLPNAYGLTELWETNSLAEVCNKQGPAA